MKMQKNILLKNYTTFRVGGSAKYFSVIENINDLKQAIDFTNSSLASSDENQLPVFVLGGGSNLLVSDKGVNGLVLKMEIKGIRCGTNTELRGINTEESKKQNRMSGHLPVAIASSGVQRSGFSFLDDEETQEKVQIIAGAGEIWDKLVQQTVNQNLYGLENLSYIPGTVGASVVQNIGAYGAEVKDIVDWVEVFDIKTGKIKKLTGKACEFGYRDSIFKKPEGKNLIVIRVAYNLQKNGELNTNYKDIKDWIASSQAPRNDDEKICFSSSMDFALQNPSLRAKRSNPENPKQLRRIIIEIRKNKLPDWKKIGTAGSFFKNPVVSKEKLDEILKKYPNLPNFEQNSPKSGFGKFHKISMAYILDKILKLKGFKEGEVGIFDKHSLVVVNHGKATTDDIKKFTQKVSQKVKDRLGVDIESEVVMW